MSTTTDNNKAQHKQIHVHVACCMCSGAAQSRLPF